MKTDKTRITDTDFWNNGNANYYLGGKRTRNCLWTTSLHNGNLHKALFNLFIACLIYTDCYLYQNISVFNANILFIILIIRIPLQDIDLFSYTSVYMNRNHTILINSSCFTCTYTFPILHLSMYIVGVALSYLPVQFENISIYLTDKIHFTSLYRYNFTPWFIIVGRFKYGRHSYTPQKYTYTHQKYKCIIPLLFIRNHVKYYKLLTIYFSNHLCILLVTTPNTDKLKSRYFNNRVYRYSSRYQLLFQHLCCAVNFPLELLVIIIINATIRYDMYTHLNYTYTHKYYKWIFLLFLLFLVLFHLSFFFVY